jgi:hypothetical protein
MKKSNEVLKNAFEKTGFKAISSDLKLSTVLLYKWCQDFSVTNKGTFRGAINPLERIAQLYGKTKDVEIINWICQKANGYFVQNNLIDEDALDAKLFNNTQRIIKEFSETLEKISECCNDGKISHKEAESIRKEWEDLKRVGESFVFACELGKFNRRQKGVKEAK